MKHIYFSLFTTVTYMENSGAHFPLPSSQLCFADILLPHVGQIFHTEKSAFKPATGNRFVAFYTLLYLDIQLFCIQYIWPECSARHISHYCPDCNKKLYSIWFHYMWQWALCVLKLLTVLQLAQFSNRVFQLLTTLLLEQFLPTSSLALFF